MELLVSGDEQADADQQSGQLGGSHSQPDAVNAQQERQQQNRRHLEQQGAQERDERAGHTVAQGREEGGRIDVEPHDEEAQAIEPESPGGQNEQVFIIAHKEAGHMGDDEHGADGHSHCNHADELQALAVEVVDLFAVIGTVVVADDGSTAHGVAHKHCHEQEGCIHDHTIGGHAILARKTEQLIVVQDVHQRHGKVGHQLRGAVHTGFQQHTALKLRAAEVEQAGVVPVEEVEHRQQAAHHLTEHGGNGGTLHAPMQDAHQQHVQHHVGAARAHREIKAQMRLFGGDKKALEHILQDKGGQAEHQHPAITQGVVQHLAFGTQHHGHRPEQQHPQHGQHDASDQRR